MKQRDDNAQLYNIVGLLDKCSLILLVVNIVATAIALFIPQALPEIVFWGQLISSVGYVLLSFYIDCWPWFSAEKSRRLDCIANGFEVNISERKTEGYFNNALPPSVLRYAANNFESAFFTKHTAKAMRPMAVGKIIIAAMVFVSSLRLFADGNLVLLIVQTCFSSVVLTDQLLILLFGARVERVYEQFYTAFISGGQIVSSQKEALLLSYAVEYETLKAFFKVRLSTKIYNRDQVELSEKWGEIARNIKI